ncbi:MAG TPA: succinate dehydrogenase, cytochrome b556 subunit [Gammaproteobacteria bacterium]|nr:succinate dehydrogenase, cytochrome b556 subunit [Gammaproteobacteria bacterium]
MAWTDKRPMSPHLQIYKLPMTAMLSVMHRGTGVVLSAGSLFLIWALAAAATGPESFALVQTVMSSWFGYLVLFGFTGALYFHLCTGVRHLIWDLGKGLQLQSTKKSGVVLVVIALTLTALTWLIAFTAG